MDRKVQESMPLPPKHGLRGCEIVETKVETIILCYNGAI